jgi:ABC-2 type transport system ATP-binding protein
MGDKVSARKVIKKTGIPLVPGSDGPINSVKELIGVQLQETTLYKKYTVAETLRLFASFYKNPVSVESILVKMDLKEKENVRLEKLSGGQKQRVYLGCALINNPKLLFLDEPTAGLDPQARRNIWDVVKKLKKEGRSVLLTTHYMDEAVQLADRVAIMDHGKIIAEGSPKSLIRENAQSEIIVVSLEKAGCTPLEIQSKMIEETPFFGHAQYSGSSFEISSDDAGQYVQELIRSADKVGAKILSLSMRPGTLEDVFIKLTGRSIQHD